MIRINLLKSRNAAHLGPPQPAEAKLRTSGSATFISKREVALGGLFLLLGGVILATQVFDVFEDPVLVRQFSGVQPHKEAALEMPAQSSETETEIEPAEQPAAVAKAAPPPAPTAASDPPTVEMKADPKPSPKVEAAKPVEPVAASAAAPSAETAVTDINVVPWGDSAEVFIAAAGAEYNTFPLDNPPRFVVDIKNAQLRVAGSKRNMNVNHSLIHVVRAAQNSLDPPLVRVVIETAGAKPEVSSTEAGVSVKLSPSQ